MKVAILSRYCHPFHRYGGLERMVYHHCRGLENAGIDVTLFTEPPFHGAVDPRPARTVRFVPTAKIPFRYRRGQVVPDRIFNYPWFSLRLGRIVAAEARRERFDLVQGNGLASFGYAFERERRPDLPPLIFNPPGFEEFEAPNPLKWAAYSWFRAMFRYAARRAARVAAPDDCLVEKTIRYTGSRRDRVFVLRNGIDLRECLDPADESSIRSVREKYDLANAGLVILSVGRISANKGFDLLARALVQCRDRLPRDWRWVHVGEGTGRPAIEALIGRIGIAENVRLTGFADESTKHSLFEIADLFVHPTLYEGSSIVTIEALAHSRPIVATAAGGIPDKVLDGENGRLVPPGDVGALGAAIAGIAAMPAAERRRLGERSKRLCEEKFLWDRIVQGLIAVYRDVLGETRR